MILRSSEGRKRKMDDKTKEDHSCSGKKITKAGTVYGDGFSASTSTRAKKTDGDAQIFPVNGGTIIVLNDVEDTTRIKPLEIGNQPAVEADPWEESIKTNNINLAANALKHGLPNQSQLDDLVKHFGRKPELITICEKICSAILARDKNIVRVWATYRADEQVVENIVFVVVVKKDISLDKIKEFTCRIRKVGHVNDEGNRVLCRKTFDKYHDSMSVDEIRKIRESINNNNIKLMQQHKYLTIISGSPVRSKGYGGSHKIKREGCIALYVFVKGYVPINEEPFQKQYDDVRIDVREGIFVNYGAKDFQETLKNGCQIERYLKGTLGGFINHPEFGTCGLTSGHVLLSPDEFKKFGPGKTVQDWNYRHTDNKVYQPSKPIYGRRDHFCGMLVRAIHDKGGGGKSGMNVAIFQVEKRYPENGGFPCHNDGRPSEMQYDSGKTVSGTRLGFGAVKKFGAATEEKQGNVLLNCPIMSVKYIPEITLDINNQYSLILHNLLEIKSTSISDNRKIQQFADNGDSGSLVFCEGEAGKLFCVGMVEGGTTAKTCAVMPIVPILQQLQIAEMKNFEKNKLEEKVDKGFENTKTEIEKMKQYFDVRFDGVINAVQANHRNNK